tara:strand:+ start:1014 stop:1436 length:423 start_codon:yes stop_codon:yes gene_type:complete
MSIRFENQKDLERESKAVSLFCKEYGLTFEKLSPNDIDFKIYNKTGFLFYLEVKGRMKSLSECYPLPIAVRKLIKISDKKENAVILWACLDGVVFSRVENLKGDIRIGGRKPRGGSTNDIEFMAYYNNNNNFKQLHYEGL